MLRSLFADPLTIKELSGVARRWQSYVSRMIYVALIGVIVYFFWLQLSERSAYLSPSEMAEMGRILFYIFGGLQLLFVTLAGISAASDLITREVRGGTLGLLSLTPLSPWRIAAGKWKAAMVQALMVILCGVPVLAICVFLGGIGTWQLLWCTSLSIASAALGAAISLLFSSLVRTGTLAILLSIVVLFLYNLLPGLLAASAGSKEVFDTLCYVQVHYAYVSAATSMSFGGQIGSSEAWIVASVLTLVLVGLLLRVTASRIEVLLRSAGGPSLLARTFDAMDQFYSDVSPRPLKKVWNVAATGAVWERHAILWKELRTRAAGKLRNATRIGLGIVLLFLLPLSCLMTEGRGWAEPMLWMSAVLLLFMAMSNGAGLFVQEKEEKKWEVLLSTPLSATELIRAKLLAGAVPLLPVSILLGGIYTVLGLVHGVGLAGWVIALGSIALCVTLAYVLGSWASLRAQNLRASFSLTFGLVLMILVVLPLLLLIFTAMFNRRSNIDEFPMILVQVTNPAGFIEPFASAVGRSSYYGYGGPDRRYDKLAPLFLVYAALYGGTIVWLLASMRLNFGRITGRS